MAEGTQMAQEELQRRYAEAQQRAAKEAEAETQIDAMMRRLLSDEAKARLGNVKLANRELYYRAVQAIMALYQNGRIYGKISEDALKEMLSEMSSAKRETKITRK